MLRRDRVIMKRLKAYDLIRKWFIKYMEIDLDRAGTLAFEKVDCVTEKKLDKLIEEYS